MNNLQQSFFHTIWWASRLQTEDQIAVKSVMRIWNHPEEVIASIKEGRGLESQPGRKFFSIQ
jgi:hypothetical protein